MQPPSDDDHLREARGEIERTRYYLPSAKRINTVLAQLMARRGYARLQEADQYEAAWRAAAGPLAEQCALGRLKRGVLEVAVRNSAVLQELTFQKKQLLARLQAHLGTSVPRDLRLFVGAVD